MPGQVTLLRRIPPPSEWPQSNVPNSYSWATSPGAQLRVGPRAWTGGKTESFVCHPGSRCPAGPQTDTDPAPAFRFGNFPMRLLVCLYGQNWGVSFSAGSTGGLAVLSKWGGWPGGGEAVGEGTACQAQSRVDCTHLALAVCRLRCLRITGQQNIVLLWREGDSDTGYNLDGS